MYANELAIYFPHLMSTEEIEFMSVEEYARRFFAVSKSFHHTLFAMIRSKKLKETDVYKAANMDRRLFSHIRTNPLYNPSRDTVRHLSLAMHVSIDEAYALFHAAGFTFSPSSLDDHIFLYFLIKKEYNIVSYESALFQCKKLVKSKVVSR